MTAAGGLIGGWNVAAVVTAAISVVGGIGVAALHARTRSDHAAPTAPTAVTQVGPS